MKKGTIFTDVQRFLFSGEEKNQNNVFSSENETFFFAELFPEKTSSGIIFSVKSSKKKNISE